MPSTPDLHTRLLAEIERRKQDARRRTAAAWWAVDFERRYAHYRKVLERHVLDHSSPFCGACSWWEPGAGVEPIMGVPWPCDEIRDLAEALAIETGDADAQHP